MSALFRHPGRSFQSSPTMTAKDDVNRTRIVRRRARSIGLNLTRRGQLYTLYSANTGLIATAGDLDAVDAYVADRFEGKPSGPSSWAPPDKWAPWIEMFVREQRAAKRSKGSIRIRVAHLTQFARQRPDLGPLEVTRADLVDYMSERAETWTANTARSARTTFRVFFSMLFELEHRADDPARRLPSIRSPRAVPRPCPDHVIEEAYAAVPDARTRLAIRVAVETGMRRGEIASLRTEHVTGEPGDYFLFVRGKGGHDRYIPIADGLATVILDRPAGFVFLRVDGRGPISPWRIARLISEALPGQWTTHTLRHRFATRAYEFNTDLRAVQELLGHASPVTTAIYTRVPTGAMRQAAQAAALD